MYFSLRLMTYHWICNQINTTGATSGTGTAYPSGAPEFTPGFSRVRVTRSIVMCMFCRSLFVLLQFFFWSLFFLFFDIRILIPLCYLQTLLIYCGVQRFISVPLCVLNELNAYLILKFSGYQHNYNNHYGISVSQLATEMCL